MSATVDERIGEEIEALEAILMEDVFIRREDDVPVAVEIVINPSTGENVNQQFVCITLEVRLTSGYPDSSPEVILRNPRGLDDDLLGYIHSQIHEKLMNNIGQPVIYEVIEMVRENLTKRNLPSGQCAICLFGFAEGDVFTKTQCYHHFHSYCLANHLIAGKKNYEEEFEKLPNWQQMSAPAYQQTCPVCRCIVSFDADMLKKSPQPMDSITAPPFYLTDEMKALQEKMAALLKHQIAKGGVVGMGDTGPPPLTITTPEDNETEAATASPSVSQDLPKSEVDGNGRNVSSTNDAPGSPNRGNQVYRGPYRGFKRGKPGRRGRGGGAR